MSLNLPICHACNTTLSRKQRRNITENVTNPPYLGAQLKKCDLIYSYSPSLSQISLKNSFGKVVSQNLAKIEMTRNKNRKIGYLTAILKRYNIFFLIWQNCNFPLPVHILCKFHCKFPVGKWFSQGVPWNPPWAPTGVKVSWSLKC